MLRQKVLFIDLETAPNLAYVWEKYEQDVIAFKKERYLLCYAYKWLGDKNVKADSLYTLSQKQLVKKLHSLFNEADIIIAQNGDNFDIKMANAFFIKFGLTPPSPYKTIDTLKIARNKFRFNSNRLDDLGEYLGLGRKIKTDKDLWLGCMSGKKDAWAKMIKYNIQDIVLLEKIYDKLSSWATNSPAIYIDITKCLKCGSGNIQHRGWYYSNGGKTKRKKISCVDCGKWSFGKNEKV